MRLLAAHLERAGFAPGTPVAIARCDGAGVIEEMASGIWPSGRPVATTDRFYVASLAKQVTAAAVALLVRDGRLDPDLPVSTCLHDLPAWSRLVTPRQLAYHTSGLPAAGEVEPLAPGDWTADFALGVLRECELSSVPGTTHSYSNLGYILLAHLVAEISGKSFGRFVASRLLAPLGLDGIEFVDDIAALPQAALLGPSLPLTHGDGGLWSTAGGFARWLHRQNGDALGIAALVETPGRLNDGSPVAYGWGLGIREHHSRPLLIHGGEWRGAVAKAVRSPGLGLAVVGMAAGARFELLDQLIAAVLDDVPQ